MKDNNNVAVLVVEDDEFIRKAYETKLAKEGFSVSTASNGQEAVAQITQSIPHIILLDLIMPIMDGKAFLNYLKDNNLLEKTNVIVLSNLGDSTSIKDCLDLGAKDYLVKSNMSINDIVEHINKWKPNN